MRLQAETPEAYTEPLLDFIPRVTPYFESPVHLKPLADLFVRIEAAYRGECEPVRACISLPPQHSKSETTTHGLVWLASRLPGSRSAYVSYGIERSYKVSRSTQWIAQRAGFDQIEGARDSWWINGSELKFTGIGGSLTGEPISLLLVVDDPHKDRADADSAVMRGKALDWYGPVARTRCHPRASQLIVATRWHPDDLIGTMSDLEGWEVVNLPAINDGTDPNREIGEALWPSQRPLSFLEQIRDGGEVSEYDWISLYQGKPRPRGSELFGEPTLYRELPKNYRVFYGTDLAYTAKTYADFSVAVRLLECDGRVYVHEVRRRQCDATEFAKTLVDMVKAMPGPMLWHCATSEKGAAQFLQGMLGTFGIRKTPLFNFELATTDKFQRAQPCAAAWGASRVLVPDVAAVDEMNKSLPEAHRINPQWIGKFLSEVRGFTGVADRHDDQVDALSSGFHMAMTRPARRSF